jgi:phage major head subunit gpT-like protein
MTISIDTVNLYTQTLNDAFVKSYQGVYEPAPIDASLTTVPSKGRIENYPFMFPPPQMSEWRGYRNWAKLASRNYRVENKVYSAQFEVKYDDLADDQVGGFAMQSSVMADNAKNYKQIAVQELLALAQTTPCFDESYFHYATHNVGTYATGGNIISATTALSDTTHAMVVNITSNKLVKPLMWQNREDAALQTDVGSPESRKARMARWWTDMRGKAAFGFWWDSILVKFSGTPTVVEMQTALGQVSQRFRSFKVPKNLPTDPNVFIHMNHQFSEKNTLILCSGGIEHIVRQALHLSLVGATENAYKGWASLAASGYLNDVV